jgi:hypothetical protein
VVEGIKAANIRQFVECFFKCHIVSFRPFGVMVSELSPCHVMNSSRLIDPVKQFARNILLICIGVFPNALLFKQSARLGHL